MVRGCHTEAALLDEMIEKPHGDGYSLLRIGAGPQLIEENQGCCSGIPDDAGDVYDVSGEGGQRLLYGLLVSDIGQDIVEHGQGRILPSRNLHTELVHHRQQSDRL